jgi:predicted Rossmann-fold nucleotide-binding protein
MFSKYAVGLIFFPGGYGTLDEFYDSLTLIQTEKIHRLPVAMVGKDFWGGQLKWVRETMLDKFGHISPEDMHLFHLTDDPADAVRHICEHLAQRDRELGGRFQKWDTPEGKVIP